MANGDNPNLVPDPERYAGARVVPPRRFPPGYTGVPAGEAPPLPPGGTLPSTQGAQPDIPRAPMTLNEQIEQRKAVLKGKLGGPGPEATGWQRFRHGLSVVGQDIGMATRPDIVEHIPGSIPNMRRELEELTKLQSEEQEREATAKRGEELTGIERTKAEAELRKSGMARPATGELTVRTPSGGGPNERLYEWPQYGNMQDWIPEGSPVPDVPPSLRLQQLPPAGPTGLIPTTGAQPAPPPPAAEGALPRAGAAAAAPPPMAAPTTQAPRYTYGKPEKRTEMEEHVDKYLKENNLPDTAQNRDIARQDYTYGPQIGEAKARQYRAQVESMLRDYKIDPAGFVVGSTMREPEAKEVLDRAQRAADNARIAAAPEKAEGIKSKHTWGYSETPEGQTIWTNEADAGANKMPFNPAPPGENAKDRKAIGQIGDVQLNTSRYTKAARDYDAAVTNGVITQAQMAKDQAELHNLLNKAGMFDVKLTGILELDLGPITALGEALSREAKSRSYDMLSPQAQNLYNGYLRTVASVPAYVKMLSDVGRTNKETLDLELKNIADPSMGTTAILQYQKNFQENIDRATKRLPNNLPGLEKSMPADIRKSIEGQAGGAARGTAAAPREYNQKTRKFE